MIGLEGWFLWDTGGSPAREITLNSRPKQSCPQRVNSDDERACCASPRGVSKRRCSRVDPRRSLSRYKRCRKTHSPGIAFQFSTDSSWAAAPLSADVSLCFPLAVIEGFRPSLLLFFSYSKAKQRFELTFTHLLKAHLFLNLIRPPCFGFCSRNCSVSWSSGVVWAYRLNRVLWEAAVWCNLLECGRCLMQDDISPCVLLSAHFSRLNNWDSHKGGLSDWIQGIKKPLSVCVVC